METTNITTITPQANNSLMALAMGDLYGSTFECLGLQGFNTPLADLPSSPPAGSFTTDDTHVAVMFMENVLTGWDAQQFGWDLQQWAATDLAVSQGIGIHTSSYLNGHTNQTSQGNGMLMYAIPATLQWIAMNNPTQAELEAFLYEVQDVTGHEANVEAILYLLGYDVEVNIQHGDSAWVANSLGAVTNALANCNSLAEGIIYVTSLGGDTDTNAAIFGAVYAANNGLDLNPFSGDWSVPASSGVFQV